MKQCTKRLIALFAIGLAALALPTLTWAQTQPAGPYGPYRQAAAAPEHLASQPRTPFGQLTPPQQKYLDDILNYWEYRSNKVKTFRCTFLRWEYKPTFEKDPNIAWTVSEGVIKYAQPDKGMFRVDTIKQLTPQQQGGQPAYQVLKDSDGNDLRGEHWICDGRSVFVFDSITKRLTEEELPEEMRGKAIADGPLPFVFGAKADKLKQRYWIRPVKPPEGAVGEYWLEAWPRRREDAANFQRIDLILDEKDFLPKAMKMVSPGGGERTVYQFSDRKVNDPLGIFQRDFSKPSTPRGWTKHVVNAGAARPAIVSGLPRARPSNPGR